MTTHDLISSSDYTHYTERSFKYHAVYRNVTALEDGTAESQETENTVHSLSVQMSRVFECVSATTESFYAKPIML